MCNISRLLMVLFFGCSSLNAQESAQSRATVLIAPPVSVGCPVNFSAKRRAVVEVRKAKDAGEKDRRQGLELAFDRKDAPKIVKVNVTVHGVSGRGRVMPTRSNAKDDVVESFQLVREAGAASLLQSELWMHKVSTVQWVALTEIEYSDGSVWRESAGSRCSVAPDLFLLVADGR